MNNELQAFARQKLKEGLSQLPDKSQILFKLMYGQPLGARDRTPDVIENIKLLPIDTVVDQMPADCLDWAMQQVTNTFRKLNIKDLDPQDQLAVKNLEEWKNVHTTTRAS